MSAPAQLGDRVLYFTPWEDGAALAIFTLKWDASASAIVRTALIIIWIFTELKWESPELFIAHYSVSSNQENIEADY